ncbi:HERC1, partial [Symbiodinium natans]
MARFFPRSFQHRTGSAGSQDRRRCATYPCGCLLNCSEFFRGPSWADMWDEENKASPRLRPSQRSLLYAAPQFRGVLRVGDRTVLVKGMMMVNAKLGNKLHVRQSCVKAEWPADPDTDIQLGLDVVQGSNRSQGVPKLHAQVLSALAMRSCLIPGRKEAKAEPWSFELSGRPACWLPWKRTPGIYPAPNRPRSSHGIPQDKIEVTYQEERVTDPTQMAEEVERPWAFRTYRAKEAMLRGGRRFKAEVQRQQSDPHLPLEGFGAGHVIVDGKVLTGPVVVRRSPLMLPGDLEIWEARPSSSKRHALRARQLYHLQLPRHGRDQPGRRDYEGDIVFVSCDPDLLRLVASTPDGRGVKRLQRAEGFAKKQLGEGHALQQLRQQSHEIHLNFKTTYLMLETPTRN